MSSLFDKPAYYDQEPASYAESNYSFWRRTARRDIARVRCELERWFVQYPKGSAKGLRGDFRSNNEVHHQAAFFELFLHELLLRLGASVEIHPTVPGTTKHPDFLVSTGDTQFYLEAKVANECSVLQMGAKQRTHVVYDAINELNSPDYWINITVEGAPRTAVPTKKLKQFLIAKLSELNYDEVSLRYERSGIDALPRWRYEFDGWAVDFSPMPKLWMRGQSGIRPMGVQMSMPERIDPAATIKNAILEKAKRYGTFDKPYAIAINATNPFISDARVVDALFGGEVFVSDYEGAPIRIQRENNGVWTSPEGRYTRVSACVVFQNLNAYNFPSASVRIYLHPNAIHQLQGPLLRLPQARVANNLLEFVDGSSIGELFGVEADWLSSLREAE